MNICGNCGYQLDLNSRFCSGCGAASGAQPAPPQQQSARPTYPLQYSAQANAPQSPVYQQHAPPHPTPTHYQQPYPPQRPPGNRNPHPAASHGFAQTFGLHPAGMVLTLAVNTMVFVVGWGTVGVGWFTSIPVGIVLGGIIYQIQKKWYGDDHESALLKACIVAFLTAIPTSLPGYLTIPSGILGFFRRKS